jgi:mannose/fructose/N-acetylgalactosamine-specific phosphotransferase system component IIC
MENLFFFAFTLTGLTKFLGWLTFFAFVILFIHFGATKEQVDMVTSKIVSTIFFAFVSAGKIVFYVGFGVLILLILISGIFFYWPYEWLKGEPEPVVVTRIYPKP